MTARIREAVEKDLDQISVIEHASFSDPWPRIGFEPLLKSPNCIFIVAELEPGLPVAGYSVARRIEDEAEILNIAVSGPVRRSGVGSLLLDHTVSTLERAGVKRIFLEVRESNVAARALYRSRTFRELARRTAYYSKPPEDAVLLVWGGTV